jgi:hypothetical protein
MLHYNENAKHKPGCFGDGPPRWFPSSDAVCPPDISLKEAALLLQGSVEGRDPSHPNARARYAMDGQGRFFKAYSEDDGKTWHGYPIRYDLVPRQVRARILREFVNRGLLTKADCRKLFGSAQ